VITRSGTRGVRGETAFSGRATMERCLACEAVVNRGTRHINTFRVLASIACGSYTYVQGHGAREIGAVLQSADDGKGMRNHIALFATASPARQRSTAATSPIGPRLNSPTLPRWFERPD
jgi:hypothetical protein